ncbi:neuropeptide F receptor-like protein [Dinothrombium tinctorium]|uniref:Neuropeptide F receptor-like protein n=1 Tax=Dinothrombium tinctorium TaxID=1965070 RepID=A0A443QR92_9ACAR|nr:neuropeptide F receptor-like protein [Dinothrombium tinctorium]RWS03155.1 neuropeptide F receptor-like protein [Dinothrombium tinctorium]RWS05538.1 neuropeptide F receptor-like protein [Dinothrombium tinctorium]
MVPFLKGVVVFVSAGTVTTIAFDRLIRILYTQPIGHNLSAGNLTCRYSLLIWFLAIFLSVPVFHYKQLIEVGIKNVFSYSICVEVWPNRAGFQYTLITFAVAFIVPLCFLIVCHVKILRFLKMHMHRMNNARQVAPTAENETSESTNREESNRKNESNENTSTTSFIRNEARRHSKVMFSLIVGTISYALAWLPWNVFNLYADYYMNDVTLTFQQIYLIFSICYLIAMSSTITNAVIYGYMNTNIQREIKALKNEFMCYFKPNRRSNEVQI